MQRILAATVLAVLVLGALPAQAQDVQPQYDWPQHDDVIAALDAAAASDWVTLHTIGASVQGKELVLAEITDPTSTVPMEERVVTLITTQQHGNEPAGTPAALRLLEDIVTGEPIADTLADQVLLLWPQANPDGAEANSRANDHGTDLNRRHVHVDEPEVEALHAVVLQDWDVHVGMDHHEYSGTGIGYPSPVQFYDFDVTALYPRHGNVRGPTLELAQDIMYEGLWSALEEEGYTRGEYGTQTVADQDVAHVAGGPDPGILRNNFGLNNVAGLLIESFIPTTPNPLHDAERRIGAHRVVMDATLQYASQHGDAFIQAKRASEALNRDDPMQEYIEEWPDDPATGEPNAGNIRAPMAAAYRTEESLDALMALHGLPAGGPTDDGTVHVLAHERGGLLAAILHPQSSRSVVAAEPVTADVTPGDGTGEGPVDQATPFPAVATLALLGLVALLRRRG